MTKNTCFYSCRADFTQTLSRGDLALLVVVAVDTIVHGVVLARPAFGGGARADGVAFAELLPVMSTLLSSLGTVVVRVVVVSRDGSLDDALELVRSHADGSGHDVMKC